MEGRMLNAENEMSHRREQNRSATRIEKRIRKSATMQELLKIKMCGKRRKQR